MEDLDRIITEFFNGLVQGKIDKMSSFCREDVILEWGPFKFKGKAEVEKWSRELLCMFMSMSFINKNITVIGDRVIQEFVVRTINLDESKGMIPATGLYDFKGKKLIKIKINLGDGIISQKAEVAERYIKQFKSHS